MAPKYYKRCSRNGGCDNRVFRTKEGCEYDAMEGDTCTPQSGGGVHQRRENPWVEHVKVFARRNGMSYPEALKSEECRREYNR